MWGGKKAEKIEFLTIREAFAVSEEICIICIRESQCVGCGEWSSSVDIDGSFRGTFEDFKRTYGDKGLLTLDTSVMTARENVGDLPTFEHVVLGAKKVLCSVCRETREACFEGVE